MDQISVDFVYFLEAVLILDLLQCIFTCMSNEILHDVAWVSSIHVLNYH